jgi:hypothetical protein
LAPRLLRVAISVKYISTENVFARQWLSHLSSLSYWKLKDEKNYLEKMSGELAAIDLSMTFR